LIVKVILVLRFKAFELDTLLVLKLWLQFRNALNFRWISRVVFAEKAIANKKFLKGKDGGG
jgi:hypothetical protein